MAKRTDDELIAAALAYDAALADEDQAAIALALSKFRETCARYRAAGHEAGNVLSALTPTQLGILTRMSAGDSNVEIAEALGIKAGTLKVHATAIFKALDVRNRIQAIDTYWRAMGEPRGIEGKLSQLPKLANLFRPGENSRSNSNSNSPGNLNYALAAMRAGDEGDLVAIDRLQEAGIFESLPDVETPAPAASEKPQRARREK
ncbi:helix-turn-helix transcriptional regulator [Aerophototrophica crusticola]|uniref:Helix-turn-helix transcriptional regulator n=1 Tax=Aerophototrophica crusticola TaxID=1709002 RepID=A0A858R549_9PROT|nr:helix-turn-helix transcriptional regulator [Rhodospirillaceae bacterium B3]